MAKFKELNLELNDNEKIILSDDQNTNIYFDGEALNIEADILLFSESVSGETTSASAPAILTTKKYVDDKCASGCRIYNNTAQDVEDATWTWVHFNTVIYDNLDEYDPSTYKFKPKNPGIYMVSAGVHLTSLIDGSRMLVSLIKNEAEHARGSDHRQGAAFDGSSIVCATVPIVVGDSIQIMVYHTCPTPATKQTYADPTGAYVYMIVQRVS